MKIRDDVLELDDDIGTSGTKIYNLDYKDPITGISLFFEATNGATDNKNNPIERNISKIEIVDGSEVLWSLPGDVAYALYSQLNGAPANEYHTGATSDSPQVAIPILFGRELYDPELAFNPRNFRNPQLRVTFDEATVRAAGATGFVSDSITLTILTHLMEDAPEPSGFLMCKDIEDYTSLGSGDHPTEMPTDYPYRMVMVRVYEAGTDLRSSITNYKLNCDGGKFVPFDIGAMEAVTRMTQFFKPTLKAGYDGIVATETVQTWIGIDLAQGVTAHVGTIIAGMGSAWPAQASMFTYDDDGTDEVDSPLHWHVIGWCPHNLLIIPFGRLDILAEYFDARQYGTIKLVQSQGDADAEVNVCVQQLRT